jgi:hypothetical protein
MRLSATTSLVRDINRTAVLDLMRRESPIARSQIARNLNMDLPTVVRIVDELMSQNLVRLHGTSEHTGGRPRPLLEFNGRAYAMADLDLSGERTQWPAST